MQVVHTAARRMGPSWLPRRRLLRALAGTASGTLGAALALTTACAERTAQRPAGEAPSELVFMDWSNIENTPTETVVTNFRAKFPQVQLAVEPTPQNYEEKMRTLIAAGTPADVHRVNDDYVRGFATKGQFVDLSPYLKRDKVKREDFYEFIYDFPIYEGKYWAWSTGNQPRLLYVNKTLFQNNGLQPPAFETWDPAGWTWDETILAAQKLTKDAHTERPTYGISLYHDTGYEQTFLVNSGI
ncbi:MAG TPA: extracellular solute-binding protein, partial [Chloroflexota bacterium]|nr:extracellular solute-binding protein [Chloroflexota bacterium]